MGDVVELNTISKLPIPPEKCLQSALDMGLDEVVIAGFDREGNEQFWFSETDAGAILYLLERCRHELMKQVDREIEGSGDDAA